MLGTQRGAATKPLSTKGGRDRSIDLLLRFFSFFNFLLNFLHVLSLPPPTSVLKVPSAGVGRPGEGLALQEGSGQHMVPSLQSTAGLMLSGTVEITLLEPHQADFSNPSFTFYHLIHAGAEM